jgi:CHAT domain
LKAGAVSVLCYRSSVSDSSAQGFAMNLYKNLAEEGELDLALHQTRRAAYERAPNDLIWMSAMLLDQSV